MKLVLAACLVFVGSLTLARAETDSELAGLFMTKQDRGEIRKAAESGSKLSRSRLGALMSRADGLLSAKASPFWMEDIAQIRFGRCGAARGRNDTVSELCDELDKQSGSMRDLALAYSLSGKKRYAKKAEELMLAWARGGTLLNLYDLNIDFEKATFDGMTTDGFCSDRPWNMALDGMWQCYGLINASDAFVLLDSGGYEFGEIDKQEIEVWIRSLAEAVNSSFHAWTRWADANPSSSAFQRYRSDNHLSWCLAGLLAAAIALDDDALAAYVLSGGEWEDSKAGAYANPSSIRSVLQLAIQSDPNGPNHGRMFEEKILRKPPMGYSLFHLWPMTLVATMAEKRYGETVWVSEDGDEAGLKEAFERYARYVLGELDSPKPEQEGRRDEYAWLFEIASSVWPEETLFRRARDSGRRDRDVRQSIGPVSLIYGR